MRTFLMGCLVVLAISACGEDKKLDPNTTSTTSTTSTTPTTPTTTSSRMAGWTDGEVTIAVNNCLVAFSQTKCDCYVKAASETFTLSQFNNFVPGDAVNTTLNQLHAACPN